MAIAKQGQHVPDEELRADVEAYVTAGGNRSEGARIRGLPRMTFNDRLKEAEVRFGMKLGRVADGRIETVEHEMRELPKPGSVARYIFTSAQNNTHLHPGWINLKAYSDWLNTGLGDDTCEFMVGTYSYALDAYGAKSVKRGSWKPDSSGPWYDPQITEFIKDNRIELAPGLVWCGEMNILPTAPQPLSGLDTYNGRKSNIIPHAKIAMESVASMAKEGTKFNWTTGTITQRNYIQKGAGIKAERGHSYGGLLVEVSSDGNWWARQLHIDGNGHIYDIGPSGFSGVRIADALVRPLVGEGIDSITWGDIHEAEMEPWVRELGWTGHPSMLDTLRPKRQIMHDIFSMRSRGHHEMKDFHSMYAKQAMGIDSVEAEVESCAVFLRESHRPWCETIVVPSNHDRHLNRWLKEEDPRKDLKNARYHGHLQSALLASMDRKEWDFNILEYALREKAIPDDVRFLLQDESFVICRDVDGGIECGLHGDLGSGGARGSTRGLARLGRAVNKGHDHKATIHENVYSVGACSLDFAYMKGPSAHSISHVVTFENARRQIITMWEGRFRA